LVIARLLHSGQVSDARSNTEIWRELEIL